MCGAQPVTSNFDLPVSQVIDAYAELAENTLLLDPSLPNSNILIKSGKGVRFTNVPEANALLRPDWSEAARAEWGRYL